MNLGGDISVAGAAPGDGWRIGLALDSASDPKEAEVVVTVRAGGLASSGTAVRTWRRGPRVLHHIVDPRTGDVAVSPWALMSAAATTCPEANAATTAAIVLGEQAPEMLSKMGLPARRVHHDGRTLTVGGWPPGPPSRRPAAKH